VQVFHLKLDTISKKTLKEREREREREKSGVSEKERCP
jgi:hypothetical protein